MQVPISPCMLSLMCLQKKGINYYEVNKPPVGIYKAPVGEGKALVCACQPRR